MDILFADTGVQFICVPLDAAKRFANAGHDWHRAQCKTKDAVVEYPYIQWHIRKYGDDNKLFIAVDTTCGDEDHDEGYFCRAGALFGDYQVSLAGLLGNNGQPLAGLPEVAFIIRPATAEGGDAKDVHMVVDFGNNRSGALLLEFRGEIAQTPIMTPFELLNRFRLDSWDAEGHHVPNDAARWFSSKTHWCSTPYQAPPAIEKIEYQTPAEPKGGFFGGGKAGKPVPVTRKIVPKTFQDLSMVRMGREADELALLVNTGGDARTGASSPKRYLWADDESWLEGANWHMFDPYNRFGVQTYATPLKGPLLTFIPENDADDDPTPKYEDAPARPRHAPRSLMTAAIYELLCQAYVFINSPAYRQKSGDSGRKRRLRSLTLTYPTGMIQPEKERFKLQAQKAIKIFWQTLGRKQKIVVDTPDGPQEVPPDLTLSIDEASAVHLTYIWSEMQKVGLKSSLWFSMMARDRGEPAAPPPEPEPEPTPEPVSPVTRRSARRPERPARMGRAARETAKPKSDTKELRIACIDIGGGTTDLMIANYRCETGIEDRIRGKVIHQDGVAWAGDQLVKCLLECIIVPRFAEAVGIEEDHVEMLFGPEKDSNRKFRAHRINWVNRLFVPLAEKYLSNAVLGIEDEISHTDPEVVSPEVLDDSLQKTIDQLFGHGYYDVKQDLGLRYNERDLDDIVQEVFDDLLFDFCEQIVRHQADIVLLAGQPTKLKNIQERVQRYLPLHKSRIVPMHNYYAGELYPYQSPGKRDAGRIVDPKSAVVVGAALEFSARHCWLPGFNFKMDDKAAENSYVWGVMLDSRTIQDEKILFDRLEKDADDGGRPKTEKKEFTTSAKRVIIGRKISTLEDAQPTPVYLIKTDSGNRIGENEVSVTLRRVPASDDSEEHLEVEKIDGTVAKERARLGGNVVFTWRTLADELYYLDTGGLDNIRMDFLY